MKKQLIPAVAITLYFGLYASSGLGQGLAEYSILTSHVATATAKAGAALGNATVQLSTKTQQKLSKSTEQVAGHNQAKLSKSSEQPRRVSHQPSRLPVDHPAVAKVHSVESASGIEVIGSTGDAKSAASQKAGLNSQTSIGSSSSSQAKPSDRKASLSPKRDQDKYPSVVNLTAPR